MRYINMNFYFTFGKYRRHTFREVIEKDRAYALWCYKNWENINWSPDIVEEFKNDK